jgi:hypothetical protein
MGGARILIAEDERGISSFLEAGLRSNGFAATVVDDGESALALARSEQFDLLVLDLGLPSRDGLSVLEVLRRGGSRLPVDPPQLEPSSRTRSPEPTTTSRSPRLASCGSGRLRRGRRARATGRQRRPRLGRAALGSGTATSSGARVHARGVFFRNPKQVLSRAAAEPGLGRPRPRLQRRRRLRGVPAGDRLTPAGMEYRLRRDGREPEATDRWKISTDGRTPLPCTTGVR